MNSVRLAPRALSLSVAIASAFIPVQTFANGITLLCEGQGYAPEISTGFAWLHSSNGNSAWGNGFAARQGQFSDTLELQINGSEGAIQLPPVIVPKINFGGTDGWWKLSRIQITDRQIAGSFSLNPINNPSFQIDRYTGRIRLTGFKLGFSGDCKPIDSSTIQKKF